MRTEVEAGLAEVSVRAGRRGARPRPHQVKWGKEYLGQIGAGGLTQVLAWKGGWGWGWKALSAFSSPTPA